MPNTIFLEDLIGIIDNKYIAANVAAKRARQLNEKKALPKVETDAVKVTTKALAELVANKLDYKAIQPEALKKVDEIIPLTPSAQEDELFEEEEEEEEPIFNEELVDDSNIIIDEEEQEEGI